MEVEVKLQTELKSILATLLEKGAEPRGSVEQVDIYYKHPTRDFAETDEALRIRREGPSAYLTYKGPKIGSKGKVREESECRVEDPDAFSLILEALGFQEAGKVHKDRRIYSWQGAEVALDRVKGLGEFMELEFKAEEGGKKEALEKAFLLIRELGLDPEKEVRRSYLELILEQEAG